MENWNVVEAYCSLAWFDVWLKEEGVAKRRETFRLQISALRLDAESFCSARCNNHIHEHSCSHFFLPYKTRQSV